jgi:hypothetical protein
MKKMRKEELGMRNKKTAIVLFVIVLSAALSASAFAQEGLKLSGEAKSGILWEQTQQEGGNPYANVSLHNKDDAGGGQGRFRLNMDYDNGNNFGFKVRIEWTVWKDSFPDSWPYAFGYGNLFDNQLTVAVGRLGASPWGSGGPEMWKELESTRTGGMRVEWKPSFIPGLNAGFVLNYANDDMDQGSTARPVSFLDLLQESIVGISYTHDLFHVRVGYRFDSAMDATQGISKEAGGMGEDEIVYRIEERVLDNYLPGFQIWALGYGKGLSAPAGVDILWLRNWLFVQYAPDLFTAQVRFGYDYISSRSDFYVKPSFYLNLFDRLVSVGASFQYTQDFGDGKVYPGSPYHIIEVEPKVQLNFTSSYIAFVYNWKQEYIQRWAALPANKEPLKQTQWMNLRFCIYF